MNDSYWIAPAPTDHTPSRDITFRRDFYAKFAGKNSGEGLESRGYQRGIALYGSEERLIAKLRSAGISLQRLIASRPEKFEAFRDEAEALGFTSPQARTDLSRIAYAPAAYVLGQSPEAFPFGFEVDRDEFLRVVRVYPQPSFWKHKNPLLRDPAVLPHPGAFVPEDPEVFGEDEEGSDSDSSGGGPNVAMPPRRSPSGRFAPATPVRATRQTAAAAAAPSAAATPNAPAPDVADATGQAVFAAHAMFQSGGYVQEVLDTLDANGLGSSALAEKLRDIQDTITHDTVQKALDGRLWAVSAPQAAPSTSFRNQMLQALSPSPRKRARTSSPPPASSPAARRPAPPAALAIAQELELTHEIIFYGLKVPAKEAMVFQHGDTLPQYAVSYNMKGAFCPEWMADAVVEFINDVVRKASGTEEYLQKASLGVVLRMLGIRSILQCTYSRKPGVDLSDDVWDRQIDRVKRIDESRAYLIMCGARSIIHKANSLAQGYPLDPEACYAEGSLLTAAERAAIIPDPGVVRPSAGAQSALQDE
ncbi:hypothetical protein GQ53DRAFT_834947 [Thozetella sp. PMI_491]|nr:hypothetical protein GQ53DRAFT_834947 [Thozetella sp. PMI_491]